MKLAGSLALCLALALSSEARATNRYLLETSGTFPANLSALVARSGGTLVSVHAEVGLAVAVSDASTFAKKMSAQSGISRVTRDQSRRWVPTFEGAGVHSLGPLPLSETPPSNDPTAAFFYSCQWNLQQIDAPGAWARGAYGSGMKVAIIDTGSDPQHVDLAGRIDLGESASFVTDSPCGDADNLTITDYHYHGSFVSGIVTTNGLGVAAVAPNAGLVAVKVLDCSGNGGFTNVIEGILYAASLADVQVINVSLGDYVQKSDKGAGPLVAALAKTVNYAMSRGKLFVASAGNDAQNLDELQNVVHVPSGSGSAVGIYATSNLDELASYSNYGESGSWVGAPGGDFPNTAPALPGCDVGYSLEGLVVSVCATAVCGGNDFYLLDAGTSFSAPLAAGVAALVDGVHGGALNAGQLKTALANSATDLGVPGTDPVYGHGRVNAAAAVSP